MIEESKQEEEAVNSREIKVLGVPKVEDGIVLDCKTKPLTCHFSMPINNASTINNLLYELVCTHLENIKVIVNNNNDNS